MATAYENLIKHLKLAIRQMELLRTTDCGMTDELLDLIDMINGLALASVD